MDVFMCTHMRCCHGINVFIYVFLTANKEVQEGVRRYFEMFGRVTSESDLSKLDKIFKP